MFSTSVQGNTAKNIKYEGTKSILEYNIVNRISLKLWYYHEILYKLIVT